MTALVMVSLMGIMLGFAGQTWTMAKQREREVELLFRGMQMRNAIASWYDPVRMGPHANMPLRELKDLAKKDLRSLNSIRHLRRLYKDPITGKDWVTVNRGDGGIVGVRSSSEEKPLKTGNFPAGLELFEGKTKYSDWVFQYDPQAGQQTGATTQSSGTTSQPSGGGTQSSGGHPPSTGSVIPPNEDNQPPAPVEPSWWPK